MYNFYNLEDFTKEEQAKIRKLRSKSIEDIQALLKERNDAIDAGKDHKIIDEKLANQGQNDLYNKYLEKIERRRFSLFNGNLNAIYDDAVDHLPLLIKKDFIEHVKAIDFTEVTKAEKEAILSRKAVIMRIKYRLTMHLEELRKDEKMYNQLLKELETQVEDYKYNFDVEDADDPALVPNELLSPVFGSVLQYRLLPTYHGKESDAFLKISPGFLKANTNPLTPGVITINNTQFRVEDPKKTWGLNEKKLYAVIRSQLTRNNKKGAPINVRVSIPIRAYGECLGKQLTPRIMKTAEEQEAENKRISVNMRNFRREISKSLSKMSMIKLKGPRGTGTSGEIALIPWKSVDLDFITLDLHESFVKNLVNEAIQYIPISLLRLPNKNQYSEIAMNIALKMLEHASNFKNYRPGVDPQILAVKTLLKDSGITSYESLEEKKEKRHWHKIIKGTLENALETLQQIEFLDTWDYCKIRGAIISDEERPELIDKNYHNYENLNIKFTFKDKIVFEEKLKTWQAKTNKKISSAKKRKTT